MEGAFVKAQADSVAVALVEAIVAFDAAATVVVAVSLAQIIHDSSMQVPASGLPISFPHFNGEIDYA
jgi:hypothetical protein